jgi:hypothetical protein
VDAALQNDVVFTAGDENGTPQTTIGVRLERLVALMDELSRPNSDAKSELMGLAGRANPNAAQFDVITDVVLGTPMTLALHDNNRPAYAPSDAMKGLVAMLIQYLRRGAVIGAGSVVTRDVPEAVFAAGNPCRVVREITE